MAYLLVVDLQPEFVKDSPGKLVYQRCLDYINYCGANYDEVIAAVYKNTDSKNMHALVRWDEMQKIQKIEFKPTKMYVHSGYSIGARLNFNEHTKADVIGLDTDACVLKKNGKVVELTSVEYRIMELLMSHPGKVYTKQQIYEAGWEDDFVVADNNIMVCISKLRSKLSEDQTEYIKTIRGLGYRMEKQNVQKQQVKRLYNQIFFNNYSKRFTGGEHYIVCSQPVDFSYYGVVAGQWLKYGEAYIK